jgi:hypothetical protein
MPGISNRVNDMSSFAKGLSIAPELMLQIARTDAEALTMSLERLIAKLK